MDSINVTDDMVLELFNKEHSWKISLAVGLVKTDKGWTIDPNEPNRSSFSAWYPKKEPDYFAITKEIMGG